MSLFGLVLSPKLLAITAAAAFALGGIAGFRLEQKISDAAWFRAVSQAQVKAIATLQDRIKASNTAAENDAARAAAAEGARAIAEDQANALQARISAGVCLTAGDTDRLRQLWTVRRQHARR